MKGTLNADASGGSKVVYYASAKSGSTDSAADQEFHREIEITTTLPAG